MTYYKSRVLFPIILVLVRFIDPTLAIRLCGE